MKPSRRTVSFSGVARDVPTVVDSPRGKHMSEEERDQGEVKGFGVGRSKGPPLVKTGMDLRKPRE